MQEKFNWQRSFIIFGSFIIILSILGYIYYAKSRLTVDKIEGAIKKSLPYNSDKNEVLNFINTYKFNTYVFSKPFFSNDLMDNVPENEKGAVYDCLGTWIYDVDIHLFSSSSILVTFYFNKEHKLISYKVEEKIGK